MSQPNSEDIYSIIGFTLVYLQSLEQNIKFCTTFVLQGEAELNWDELQRLEKAEGKKALGYFLGKVRERASLHPGFDELLGSVLRDRNDFIHNTRNIPGWNLKTPDGVDVAKNFSMSLVRRAHKVNEILAALFIQWQQQANINVPTTPAEESYFRYIENHYGHLVEPYFAHRETF